MRTEGKRGVFDMRLRCNSAGASLRKRRAAAVWKIFKGRRKTADDNLPFSSFLLVSLCVPTGCPGAVEEKLRTRH